VLGQVVVYQVPAAAERQVAEHRLAAEVDRPGPFGRCFLAGDRLRPCQPRRIDVGVSDHGCRFRLGVGPLARRHAERHAPTRGRSGRPRPFIAADAEMRVLFVRWVFRRCAEPQRPACGNARVSSRRGKERSQGLRARDQTAGRSVYPYFLNMLDTPQRMVPAALR
jgi:hypothetical protein